MTKNFHFHVTRIAALILAYLFLGLAIIGIFLPGIPTVPFLLLAAWFSAKGSERLHKWLYDHPKFGKLLIDWETQGAVSRPSKLIAITMLIVSWGIMFYKIQNPWVLAGTAILFVCVAAFLLSRPEPQQKKQD